MVLLFNWLNGEKKKYYSNTHIIIGLLKNLKIMLTLN